MPSTMVDESRRRLRDDHAQQCGLVGRVERRPARDQEIQDGADAVDVGARIDAARISDALRRHVRRCPEEPYLLGEDAIVVGPGSSAAVGQALDDAEIEQLHEIVLAAAFGQHHVVRA